MKPENTRSCSTLAITVIAAFMVAATFSSHLEAAKAAPWVGKQLNGKKCANEQHSPGGGPYDYLRRGSVADKLALVENAHFPPSVENLESGKSGTIMDDLHFVLRAFPNHHRALNSAVNFSLRYKKWPAKEKGLPAECYLQRAMNFSPQDGVPYRLYGVYMHKKGRFNQALPAYIKALELYPNDAMLHYNTALLLVKMERYEEAMPIARTLYDAGLTLPGLRNKLVAAGEWKPNAEELLQIRAYLDAQAEKEAGQADSSQGDDAEPATKTGNGQSRSPDDTIESEQETPTVAP